MNRRSFLKTVTAAVAGIFAPKVKAKPKVIEGDYFIMKNMEFKPELPIDVYWTEPDSGMEYQYLEIKTPKFYENDRIRQIVPERPFTCMLAKEHLELVETHCGAKYFNFTVYERAMGKIT